MKLTRPQMELLKDCADCCPCVDSYRPAQRLVALGLAEWTRGNYGSSYLNITEAGRRAIASQDKESGE